MQAWSFIVCVMPRTPNFRTKGSLNHEENAPSAFTANRTEHDRHVRGDVSERGNDIMGERGNDIMGERGNDIMGERGCPRLMTACE